MIAPLNPWEALGVHRKSTDDEIQAAFHAIAKRAHPDKVFPRGGDPPVMQQIVLIYEQAAQAYTMLKDAKRRLHLVKVCEVYYDDCSCCKGSGCKSTTKSLTNKVYSACTECGGSGFNFTTKEKQHDRAIELRGTAGTGGAGRDTRSGKSGAGKRGKR